MYPEIMEHFLSKEAIVEHLSYYNNLRLGYSILEKSIPGIAMKSPREIFKMSLPREELNDILPYIINLKSHYLYFSSFVGAGAPIPQIKGYYSSEEDFIYRVYTAAKNAVGGFLFVGVDRAGIPSLETVYPFERALPKIRPALCIDMQEHAYFSDYGFNCEGYLKNLLPYLNLSAVFSEERLKLYLDTPI